jgi:hypothetical protein
MIRITTRAVVYALSVGAAPLAIAAGIAEPPSARTGDAMRAEMRHFEAFTHYRAMFETSGGNGQGSTGSAAGDRGNGENIQGASMQPGSGPAADRFACTAADSPGK